MGQNTRRGVGKGGRGHRRMGQEGMGGKDRVHLAGQKTLRVAIDVSEEPQNFHIERYQCWSFNCLMLMSHSGSQV